jgi:hypothetical protein
VGKLNDESSIRSYYSSPQTFMLKSLIIAATSIACVLSIANIADANDRAFDLNLITRSNLIAKQTKTDRVNTTIPVADFKGIEQAILERYKRINKSPAYPAASGGINFYEVKEMKISSFSLFDTRGSATVEVVENSRGYVFGSKNISDNKQPSNQIKPKKYKYNFYPSSLDPFTVRHITIDLTKRDGKWIAN